MFFRQVLFNIRTLDVPYKYLRTSILLILILGMTAKTLPQRLELSVPVGVSVNTAPFGTSGGLPWFPLDVDRHISGFSFEAGVLIKSSDLPLGIRYLIGIKRDHKSILPEDTIATTQVVSSNSSNNENKSWFMTNNIGILYFIGKKSNRPYVGVEWSRHNIGSSLDISKHPGFEPMILDMSYTSYNILLGIPIRNRFVVESRWIQVFRNWPFHKPPLLFEQKLGYLSLYVSYWL